MLYLSNPDGVSRESRRKTLDALAELNQKQYEEFGAPEIPARIAQYEMAYRMQRSVPDLMDFSNESKQGGEFGRTIYCQGTLTGRDHHPRCFTILHTLGINHERLTHRFQGRDFRLTDVHGNIVHDLLA